MKNKFRVWNKITNSFLSSDEVAMDGYGDIILLHDYGDWNYYLDKEYYDLVVQYQTGLTDLHGNDVYEGDIVRENYTEDMAFEGDTANIGQVFFAAGTFMIDGGGPMYDYTHSLTPDRLEDYIVIGNIFENPELLKK
jgi:uncharacterized phage protein (TIGR01671 family)